MRATRRMRVEPTGAERALAERRGQQRRARRRSSGAPRVEPVAVEARRCSGTPRAARPGASRAHPGRDRLGALPRCAAEQLVDLGPRDVDAQVEAVEQRARTGAAGSAAARASVHRQAPGRPASPHGHGFMAATSRKRAGQRHRGPGPAHPDDALLERLAQRVEHVGGELAQLVEEQHAAAARG